jgi:uncharacterized protein with NAD-binding domain and iron-sulfur cluster
MNSLNRPVRVAIVGGGCAALTTAFELSRPEHMGRYDITVYQMGWRLGGKGASGRGIADRVEEHGLHLWMGFYENAFRLMRECYAERHAAYPQSRFADWREAFQPAPNVGVGDRTPEGWTFWQAHFPPGDGDPGDAGRNDLYSVVSYLRRSASLIGELLRSAAAMKSGSNVAEDRSAGATPNDIASAVSSLFRYGQLATTAALLEASRMLREIIDGFFPQMFRDGAAIPIQLVDGLASAARRQIEILVAEDRELRRLWEVIDLILAVLRGSIRANLAFDPSGFDAINDYDWREWLRLNGASEHALDSGFVRGIYDLVFAYEDGDVGRPRLAAGVALRGAMRMFFTYRGSLFWRMSAGMGDIVFAPLYQVLKRRGVRFEFFHRLRNVGLSPKGSADPPYVQTLEFDVQAKVKGDEEYQPLVDVHNLPSWPARPDYAQLEDGVKLEREGRAFEAAWEQRHAGCRTLNVESDFDFAVLGVSIGALPEVASELIESEPRWRDMVRHVKTVRTQAFQIWTRKDAREMGWRCPGASISGFAEPFDTWADMSHIIPEENWKEPVRGIAYFCSPLADGGSNGSSVTELVDREQRELVRANAVHFLDNHITALWPSVVGENGGFHWGVLAADENRSSLNGCGPSRFDTQYWTANVNPTDRYVLSLPGSLVYRISPLDMTFDNLTIAGDWTASGLDSGCIESAVMSGLLAAHAICGRPALRDIVGYDHP